MKLSVRNRHNPADRGGTKSFLRIFDANLMQTQNMIFMMIIMMMMVIGDNDNDESFSADQTLPSWQRGNKILAENLQRKSWFQIQCRWVIQNHCWKKHQPCYNKRNNMNRNICDGNMPEVVNWKTLPMHCNCNDDLFRLVGGSRFTKDPLG